MPYGADFVGVSTVSRLVVGSFAGLNRALALRVYGVWLSL